MIKASPETVRKAAARLIADTVRLTPMACLWFAMCSQSITIGLILGVLMTLVSVVGVYLNAESRIAGTRDWSWVCDSVRFATYGTAPVVGLVAWWVTP